MCCSVVCGGNGKRDRHVSQVICLLTSQLIFNSGDNQTRTLHSKYQGSEEYSQARFGLYLKFVLYIMILSFSIREQDVSPSREDIEIGGFLCSAECDCDKGRVRTRTPGL